MIKKLIVILITITSVSAFSQRRAASPYSFYGLGSLKYKGTVENRSMGGISVYLDSIHVNLKNPAAYAGNNMAAYDNESRAVKFAVAGGHTDLGFESNTSSGNASSSTFEYMTLTMPLGEKFGFGFGLMPYTSVGYSLESFTEDNDIENRYRGDGGVNRVFAGLGYSISKKLRVGVDFNYNFGSIENTAVSYAYTPEGVLVQLQSREDTRSDLSGLNINLGLAYKTMIKEDLELSATATYAPRSILTSRNERDINTVRINPFTLDEFVSNTINVDLAEDDLDVTDLTLPSRLSLGAGLGEPKSWFVGAEYTLLTVSDFSNPVYSNNSTAYENASRFAVGGFYIPRYDAFSGYFKRVVYRAGFNFGNTGLVIKDESINEFGISFGLGLPVGSRTMFSNANIGFEYGQRGTTNQNLVKENFFNVNLSLSLNARWFEKRKFY